MSNVRVNEAIWNQLTVEAKKQIEELINTCFSPADRIRIIPDAQKTDVEAEVGPPLKCLDTCQTQEAAAINACRKLPHGQVKGCVLAASAAGNDCVRACYGLPPA